MELIVPLNVQGGRPLYEQIYQYIKDEIRKGNIRPEKQLPSSRELAKSLKVSRSTTQLAYEQLVSEGYLEAVPRKGYFAASLDGIFPPVAQSVAARPDQKKELSLGMKKESVRGQLFREKFEVDFSPRGIDLEGFPYATWRKISRSVLKEEDRELFLKGEPQGDLILREAIREYLHAARGVNCDVSQIIIGAGNEYLLMLLSQIIGRDAVIAMENPTYRQAYRVLSGVGHKVLPVGIDKNGFCVKELEGQDVQAAYVMPSHQYPTGIVMPVKRRQELLSWASEKEERYIIEDDYDCEFRYRSRSIPALGSMDSHESVIYMNTFSKTLTPAIRISYMVLPEKLMRRYIDTANFYCNTASTCEQYALARFIENGYFERHLSRLKKFYHAEGERLKRILKQSVLLPAVSVDGGESGTHLLVKVDTSMTDTEIEEAAENMGIHISCLSRFCSEKNPEYDHILVLNYSDMDESRLTEAVRRLGNIFIQW